ncbi:cupin domain-containing protein [Celeribacter sp.]|uniref:cupin domain-containing protein n=1 Tax=Celeribacter sp. TaxID=1890673 RepID=UPI003A8E920C
MARIIRIDGKSAVSQAPEQEDVVDLGIRYAEIAALPAEGASFNRGSVPAGVTVPAHAGPNAYALFVVSGGADLTLHAEDGSETERLSCAEGDLLLFPPNCQHGWINESAKNFEWFGVDFVGK